MVLAGRKLPVERFRETSAPLVHQPAGLLALRLVSGEPVLLAVSSGLMGAVRSRSWLGRSREARLFDHAAANAKESIAILKMN
jgi:hypothetical protein